MMKNLFLILLSLVCCKIYAQEPEKKPTGLQLVKHPLDTNKVMYDMQGKPLRYYQYSQLLNSGEYTIDFKGASPFDANAKAFLRKVTEDERIRNFERMRTYSRAASPLLTEGKPLDLVPLADAFGAADLQNKVIVLIFWSAECPPCTESFSNLNEYLKQIHNPEDLVFIAITPDETTIAEAKLKEKPLLYARLLSNGRAVLNAYNLSSYPGYVVADKNKIIRFSMSGIGPATIPAFKEAIKAVLQQ